MLSQNKAIVRRGYEEVWSQGNLAVITELYAPDFVLTDPFMPGIRGPEGYQHYVMAMRTPFPDLQFTVEEQLAEGDRVATRWRAHGTQQGEFMGMPPKGQTGVVTGTTISRIVNGKIVEEKSSWDALSLLQTVGVLPPLA